MYTDPKGYDAEHTKNARPSTKNKHENAESRRQKDKGGEKGDSRREYNKQGNKQKTQKLDKPKGQKYPQPPKSWIPSIPLPILPGNQCILFPDTCGRPDVALNGSNGTATFAFTQYADSCAILNEKAVFSGD